MDNLISKVESLLFISGRPMSSRELAELVKAEVVQVEEAADKLLDDKRASSSGVAIVKNGNSYQMVTAPANASLIQEFVKDETTGELSRPSLETLTIIAYRGPVSKTDLDRIRGVNCGMILHNLSMRGLIDARDDKKKDEVYYTATFDFLKFLGLSRLEDLPDYERLHKDDTIDRILAEGGEGLGGNEQQIAVSVEVGKNSVDPVETMTEEQKEVVFE
jgi:segregation and condensation protein B